MMKISFSFSPLGKKERERGREEKNYEAREKERRRKKVVPSNLIMTSSVSSSPPSTPDLIHRKPSPRSYHLEIGMILLFLCLIIPSLTLLTLLFRRESFPSSSTVLPSLPSSLSFHRISLLDYPQARCMDESIASYYIRYARNNQSRWLIYFDGGWFCYSEESCQFRRQYAPNFITANSFNARIFSTGIFSSWKQFNIIYAPYCSSDLWSGSSNQSHSHGYEIFQAIFHQQNYFPSAKQIIFTGFSAGGLGLLLNLPDLFPRFSPTTDLRVLLDSAWFIDCSANPNGISKINQGMIYWNTQLSKSCQLSDRYKCLLGSEAIRIFPSHVKIFVIQSLFDWTQLQLDPMNLNSYEFSLKLRDNLRQSNDRISIFAPSCPLHGFLFRSNWSKFRIEQTTLASAVNLWLKGKKRFHLQYIDQNFDTSSCPPIDDEQQQQQQIS